MNRQLEMVDKFIKVISKLDEAIESLNASGYMTEVSVRNKLVKARTEIHDGMIQHIKNSKEYEGLVDSEYDEDDSDGDIEHINVLNQTPKKYFNL